MAEGDMSADTAQKVSTSYSNENKLSQKPTTKKMSTYVKPYAQYWLEIGILLGISSQKLDDIEGEFENDPHSCCLRMLVEWVMSDPNATWKKLQGVIESISKSHDSNKSSDGATKSGRDRPQLHELHKRIVPNWAAKWEDLGKGIGLLPNELEIISENHSYHPRRSEECCKAVLKKWLDKDLEASWNKIETVIRSFSDTIGITNSEKESNSVSDHVKVIYKETRYKTSQDDWPPEQPQHFTSVAIIYHRKVRTKREVIAVADVAVSGSIAVGSSSQSVAQRLSQYGQESSKEYMKQSRITKSIAEIFEPFEDTDMSPPSSILIEGAPGIGKTILSKEIAYKWAVGGNEKILQDKKLVFLIYMRDPAVAQIKTIEDLVHCFYRNDPSAKDIAASCGMNLLATEGSELALILDGYDEMPKPLRTGSLFADIINRTTLPKCTLVITSRPSSSAHLHSNMERRMEILGFTEVDRKDYIEYALKGLDDQIEVLLRFLLNHPTINSLCYIPLNMTILLYLLKHSELSSLPTSQTSLYQDFICLTVCHHLRKKGIMLNNAFTNLKSFPEPYYNVILQLAKLSFIALEKSQLVFSLAELREFYPEMDAIPGGINCFGLLQAVEHNSTMHTTLSFNFVHFSVQEFLAAFYISSLQVADELEVLQQKFWVGNYYNTWIIYIGFTKGQKVAFKTLLSGDPSEQSKPTISVEFLKNTRKCLHLFQCFDEAEDWEMCRQIDKAEIFESGRINISMQTLTPMEMKSLCVFLTKSSRRQWEELSLSSCNIGDTGCSLLEVSLSTNAASIESLRLEDNQLTAMSTEMVVKIATHCKAILLDLRWNELQDGNWSSLADNTSLLGVILDGNNLRDAGARKIMAAVTKNTTLNVLRLDDNGITDKVTDDIAAAVANNTSLNSLRLCKNPLSDKGSTVVLHSLMSNKVLEWLWLPTPLSDSAETALREKEDMINNYRLDNKCNVKLTMVFS